MRVLHLFVMAVVASSLQPPASSLAEASERYDGPPVVVLSGTPYDMGRQHGTILRTEVRASIERVLGYFRHYLKIPWVGPGLVNWWLDRVWNDAAAHVPADYLEELRGLADGSGVPLDDLYRLHAIPDPRTLHRHLVR